MRLQKNTACHWKRIGIIGGMGPRASAEFLRLLLDECSIVYDAMEDADYPEIVLLNESSNVVSALGLCNTGTLIDTIRDSLAVLNSLSVEIVAIACNSVYMNIQLPDLVKHYDLVAPQLPTIVAKTISGMGAQRVLIMGGHDMASRRLIDPYFADSGVNIFYPDEYEQTLLDKLISDVMSGHNQAQSKHQLLTLIDNYLNKYDVVDIACSEFSALIEHTNLSFRVIDNMLLLAQEVLKEAKKV